MFVISSIRLVTRLFQPMMLAGFATLSGIGMAMIGSQLSSLQESFEEWSYPDPHLIHYFSNHHFKLEETSESLISVKFVILSSKQT